MSKWLCCGGFVIIGGLSLVNLALWFRDHNTSFDDNVSLTPPEGVTIQNNLFPTGEVIHAGTKMGPSYFIDSTGTPSESWRQGGSSAITNSTGRWAA